MSLSPAEMKLAAELLSLASDVFANRVCNDFDLTFLSLDERREILKAYEVWNASPKDYDENRVNEFGDSFLMAYMSYRLKAESQE